MEQGLIPKKGHNYRLCGDDRKAAVWTCLKEDIPYWMILLDTDMVISINTDISPRYHETYSEGVHEYGFIGKIPACSLALVENPSKKELTMANDRLAAEYMLQISEWVTRLLSAGCPKDEDTVRILDESCKAFMKVLSRIDFIGADREGMLHNLAWQMYDYGEETFRDAFSARRRFEYLTDIVGPLHKTAENFEQCLRRYIPLEILYADEKEIKKYAREGLF